MKLCILSDAASLHVSEWAQFFAQRGHDVFIITDNPSPINGAKIYPFPKFEWKIHVPLLSAFYQIVRKVIAIRRALKTIRPDIIHSHYANIYGFLGSLSGFHPQILTCHGSDLLVHPKRSIVQKYFVKHALKCADKITLPSQEMLCKSISYGANRQKATVFQYGIDLRLFRYSIKNRQHRRFLCTRMLTPQYRTDFIIEAFALLIGKYPDAFLDIVGDGPERNRLEKLVTSKSLESNITFWGKINHSEIARFYSQSSFYITASPTDGLSISLLEAFATGLYPILPDNKSNNSLLELGFSVKLFSLERVSNLADAIEDVLDNSGGFQEMCLSNRLLAQTKFNRDNNLLAIESVYKELINPVKA